MQQVKIVNIHGKPAVLFSEEILKEMKWSEGDCLNLTRVGHALHFSKVVVT